MARTLAFLAVVGLLAACGSSSAAGTSSAARVSCGPANGRTVARSATARVYSRGRTVYGCASGGSRPVRLGRIGACLGSSSVGTVAVSGKVAAYALRNCGVDTSSTQVVVRRLSDGHQLSAHDAVTQGTGPESFESVGSVVVTGAGHAAWIGRSDSIVAHRKTTQVLADTGSGVRVLDSGAGIATGSLRLKGSTLTWQDGGTARHATLK